MWRLILTPTETLIEMRKMLADSILDDIEKGIDSDLFKVEYYKRIAEIIEMREGTWKANSSQDTEPVILRLPSIFESKMYEIANLNWMKSNWMKSKRDKKGDQNRLLA